MQPVVTKGIDVPTLMCVAAALSEKYGVVITVSGKHAYTHRSDDGMCINIPAVSVDNSDYAKLVRGYLDHEVGHARFTDWDVMDKQVMESDVFRTLVNILEDKMVETKMSNCFAGCKYNLSEIEKLLFDACWWHDIDDSILSQTIHYILAKVRDLDPAKRAALRKKITPVLTDATVNQIDTLLDGHSYASTADNSCLARQIEALLRNKQSAISQAAYDKQYNDQVQKHHKADFAAKMEADIAKRTAQRTLATVFDSGPGVCRDANCPNTLEEMAPGVAFDARCAQMLGDGVADASPMDKIMLDTIVPVTITDGNIDFLTGEAMSKAMQQTTALASRLSSLLKAYTNNRCGHKQQGMLDTRRVASVATGNTRVFHNVSRRLSVDTDVTLLVDASGSMERERNAVASPAIYALMRALRSMHGVTSAAYALSGHDFYSIFRRTDSVTPRCNLRPFSTTPLGGALIKLFTLLPSDNRRKLVLVLTDGVADDDVPAVLSIYRKAGVKVLCVGIQDNECTKHFPKEDVRTVHQMSELPQAVFDLIQRNIIDNCTNASLN